MNKNWVTRVGVGKRAYYSLTARGDAAIKRYENQVAQQIINANIR